MLTTEQYGEENGQDRIVYQPTSMRLNDMIIHLRFRYMTQINDGACWLY